MYVPAKYIIYADFNYAKFFNSKFAPKKLLVVRCLNLILFVNLLYYLVIVKICTKKRKQRRNDVNNVKKSENFNRKTNQGLSSYVLNS